VWVSGTIVLNGEQPFSSFAAWIKILPFWLFPAFLLMFASNAYFKVWRNSSFKDYFFLILAIIIGSLFSLAFILMSTPNGNNFIIVNQILLFDFFTLLGITGIRTLYHLFREWSIYNPNPNNNTPTRRNILVYGAGQHGGLYLRNHYLNYADRLGESFIVGFVDDNPALQDKYTFGLPVLGGITDIERIALQFNINEIILSTSISSEHIFLLKQLTIKLNITLLEWRAHTVSI